VEPFPLQRKKIPQELEADIGKHGFRVELHAFHFPQFPVSQPHDDAVIAFRRDFQCPRQVLALDDERMVTGCAEPLW
jgi:hypothetical protein